MARKVVFRIGDRVRIVKPVFVWRVGYKLHWSDLADKLHGDPVVALAMETLGLDTRSFQATQEFIRGVARSQVVSRGFGGPERRLHTFEAPEFLDTYATVAGKRVAVTGVYDPNYAWCETHDEPGLDKRRTHVLLRLFPYFHNPNYDPDIGPLGSDGSREIESINVEMVRP